MNIQVTQKSSETAYEAAMLKKEEGDFEAAHNFILKAIIQSPLNITYYIFLSNIFLKTQQVYRSIVTLLFAEKIDSNNATVQEALLILLQDLGFKKVELLYLPSGRLGHFAIEANLWLRKKKIEPTPNILSLFITHNRIANQQLLTLYSRHLAVVQYDLFNYLSKTQAIFNDLIQPIFLPDFSQHGRNFTHLHKKNIDVLHTVATPLSFLDSENKKGISLLNSIGINTENDWYVTFFARDSAYLKQWDIDDCDRQSYRNSDIETYYSAMEFIIRQGGKVIRMGSLCEKPLSRKHPSIIDYPFDVRPHFSKIDADFMDIFILSRAKFMVSDYSGLTDANIMFDVPTVAVNGCPPMPFWSARSQTTYIPVRLKSNKTQEYLSYYDLYQQVIDTTLHDFDVILFINAASFLEKHNLIIEHNTQEEILAAVEEMYNRVTNQFNPSAEDIALLEKHFTTIPQEHWLSNLRTPIALSYLKKHKKLFFNTV